MTTPTVTVSSKKIRVQAPQPEPYDLDLYEAQEYVSDLVLAIEQIDELYNPPRSTVSTRTLKLSPKRSFQAKRTPGTKPAVRINHADVLILTTEQANQIVEVLVSVIEQVEDYTEARGVEPYPFTLDGYRFIPEKLVA